MKPIIPEVCDRVKCKIPSCYGWDFCRDAREELTEKEWDKFFKIFCSHKWIVESKKERKSDD